MSDTAQLDALIVRNIGNIESAYKRVVEEIDTRLWKEMIIAAKLAIETEDGWLGNFDAADEDVRLYPSEWRDGENEPQFWFQIDQIDGPEDDGPESWVADAVGDNQQGAYLALVFGQNIFSGKTRALDKVMKDKAKLRANLIGLQFGEQDKTIHLRVWLKQEILAQAFAEDIFDDALTPLSEAITKIVKNRTFFDELVAAMRVEAALSDQSGVKK